MSAFERIVEFYPAHDDFDPIKRTGSRGTMRIKFILKGPLAATQFMIGTAWGLPQSEASTRSLISCDAMSAVRPTGWDVGYHSPAPLYDGQSAHECDLLPGGKCFYDGSGLRADDWVPGFLAGGSDWVWQKLEEEYNSVLASGTLTEGGDVQQAPGDSLSGPTGNAGDAQGPSA